MTSRRIRAIFPLLLLAALPALAKPNFTGDWKLNTSKSKFGDFPAPDSMTYKVKHDEPKLTNDTKMTGQFEFEQHLNFTTDGKESTNEGFQGSTSKSIVKWDGDTLLIDTKATFGDNEINISQKWTLSADGKTLTVLQSFKGPQGDLQQTYVFDKQ